jgi:serine/threonine-protein kinase
MNGKMLGHYRVGEQLGRGGMGEVYVADDLNLNRKVALKFLPDAFAGDPERMARFEREAKLLASLNHPNIAAIYGLEQAEGKRFIVMELVEGETLAKRIGKGALPVDDALAICRQIADGLEAAHEKGVIHRDLKPANVMITEGDRVKILDFGLAKALSDETQAVDSSQSPTLTEAMTRPGVILGTAAYMSPEQAKGKSVDKRADIWAFGCILYECLTGRRAFEAETVTETLAAIFKGEPDWNALPAETPADFRPILRRCLHIDPKQRLRDAGDIRIEIEEMRIVPLPPGTTASGRHAGRWAVLLVLAAFILIAVTGIAVWNLRSTTAPNPPAVARINVNLPSGDQLGDLRFKPIALSPKGNQIAYVALRGDIQQLFIRPIDSLEAKIIADTEGARAPFFSPDGQWIDFFAGGKLRKVSVAGGSIQTLCNASVGLGGSWAADDTIYFAPSTNSGLLKVSAQGGEPQEVTRLNRAKGEISHRWPQVLPGGKAILFDVWTGPGWEERHIAPHPLESGQQRILVQGGSSARYLPTGHIVYSHAGKLMAVPFDPDALQPNTGPAIPLGEEVDGGEGANFALSETGSLAYVPQIEQRAAGQLIWVDREGRAETVGAPPRDYQTVRLSPDGRQIATHINGPTIGIWIYDLSRLTLTRLTSEQGSSQFPIWTPDGKSIVYRGTRSGFRNLYWKRADGSGMEERLTTGEDQQSPSSFSPDGKFLIWVAINQETSEDLWTLDLEGERKVEAIMASSFRESGGTVSPDGRWLAYGSDESGRYEIYIKAFRSAGGKLQVSTEGGTSPLWNRNGSELFYRNGIKMMSASIITQPLLAAESPKVLFEVRFTAGSSAASEFDVSPDGRRFLMIRTSEKQQSLTQIQLVLNWTEELKQRVPAVDK